MVVLGGIGRQKPLPRENFTFWGKTLGIAEFYWIFSLYLDFGE